MRARRVALFLIFTTGCGAASPSPHGLDMVAAEYGYRMPDTVAAGMVRLALHNGGKEMHEALVVRFTNASGNAAAYADSVRAKVLFPAFARDIGGAGLSLPGDSSVTWVRLAPGHYAVVCWVHDHLSRGMVHDLIVVPVTGATAAPPRADVEVTLTNFAYTLSAPLRAGHQVLHVKNAGTEAHEADILRLRDSTTVQDYIEWLKTEVGLPPLIPVGGLGDLMPGEEAWIEVNFPPGRYVILCTVKNTPAERPHYELGMMHLFEIAKGD